MSREKCEGSRLKNPVKDDCFGRLRVYETVLSFAAASKRPGIAGPESSLQAKDVCRSLTLKEH